MQAKYYIVLNNGDTWTIGCPNCDHRERMARKKLHSDVSGDWVLPQERICPGCGFTSRRLASLAESGEIRKTAPQPDLGSGGGRIAAVVVVVLLGLIVVEFIWDGTESGRIGRAREGAIAAVAQRAATDAAIGQHHVLVGMTPSDVVATWGHPRKKEHTDFGGDHTSDTWIYSDAGAALVIFNDGKVTSVSTP